MVRRRRPDLKKVRQLLMFYIDSRSEFLQSGSTGLLQAVEKSNRLYDQVKQTSDATIDSRLLVDAAELSHRKAVQLTLGSSAQGVDVDEFVSKCIVYMRRAPESSGHSSDGEEDQPGQLLDWAHLGRIACRPFNIRPPVPAFLLGPLSVQKRVRQQPTQRIQTQRRTQVPTTRPEELKKTDIEEGGQEASVTFQAKKIRDHLDQARTTRRAHAVAAIGKRRDSTPAQQRSIRAEYGLAGNDEISFWRYIVNPTSFGQTVENLFYVSFLIREGSVAVGEDPDGIPTLSEFSHICPSRSVTKLRFQPPANPGSRKTSHGRTPESISRYSVSIIVPGGN